MRAILTEANRLPSHAFPYEKAGVVMGLSLLHVMDGADLKPEFKVVGWTPGGSVPIRPKPEYIAVLFEATCDGLFYERGEEVWFHLAESMVVRR